MKKTTRINTATIHKLDPRAARPKPRPARRNQSFSIYQLNVAHQIEQLEDKAFALEIWTHISRTMAHTVPLPRLYMTLKRMKDYKLITGTKSLSPHNTGQTVVVYKLTDEGRRLLDEARHSIPSASA